VAALIELQDVTTGFGPQVVHDGVDLALNDRETLGLVGGSGSGKSVLLRTILGLKKPQKGQVLINGKDLYSLSEEERTDTQKTWGVLFQNGALFSGLSVLDNIALPLREHTGLSPRSIDELALLKMEMVGLESETAEKYPAALSGGMVTRAGVARALALDPKVLFLDEPTGALDPQSAASIDELMQSLRRNLNLSILIITHDPTTIVNICDRVAMIVGKKVESGTLDELLDSSHQDVRDYFSSPRMKAALATRQ
jgi:phospholipid/cholesterol/gamma-HCH transport system ATP-binding protein